ncbi:MAG TPA: cbb3-type cytochrome c oxidase subunit I, partial [Patescibacteria group bacterium]|nr:cbb3-type cytochrome c oxidase subunit I [Patescibacteria group bacterium]
GFVFLFTIGGVAGVLMAVPPIDFQVHNSLFLVAHFHTMIVSGVLFGYFAGLTYWFPKYFGFSLIDIFGKYAAYLWIIGFSLAFIPLYILGLMGATRRLDHYSASLGWHPLFIVAGVGVLIIFLGAGMQLFQMVISYFLRSHYKDKTGDPWKARTLEWSTTSPPPFYNFAIEPVVSSRDAFWAMKHSKSHKKDTEYEPIEQPKNNPLGLYIAICAFLLGFGMVWHIWWLSILAVFTLITTVIVRTTRIDNEENIPVSKIQKIESGVI